MDSKLLEKAYSNINYNTYRNLMCTEKISAGALMGLRIVLSQINPAMSNVSFILMLVVFSNILLNINFDAKRYTKDIKQIKKLYDEIIVNYNKLNDTFGFNNPVEISSMYSYLVYSSYLSKNRQFIFSNEEYRDIDGLYGSNVINGQAVCRHIAIMLSNILNNRNIYSSTFPVYLNDEIISGTKEYSSIEDSYEYIEDEPKRTKYWGNHIITITVQNGKNYILDPTNNCTYKLKSNDNKVLINNEGSEIKICCGKVNIYNPNDKHKITNSILELPSTSFEDDIKTTENIKKICKNNLDIFEQFYKDNSDRYDELSNALMLIKK